MTGWPARRTGGATRCRRAGTTLGAAFGRPPELSPRSDRPPAVPSAEYRRWAGPASLHGHGRPRADERRGVSPVTKRPAEPPSTSGPADRAPAPAVPTASTRQVDELSGIAPSPRKMVVHALEDVWQHASADRRCTRPPRPYDGGRRPADGRRGVSPVTKRSAEPPAVPWRPGNMERVRPGKPARAAARRGQPDGDERLPDVYRTVQRHRTSGDNAPTPVEPSAPPSGWETSVPVRS
jgi:hypothetical protein